MKQTRIAAMGLAVVFLMSAGAQAIELPAKTDAQKHRRDIGKQLAKYVFCLGKAAIKCEKKGTTAAIECDLTNGTTPGGFDAKAAGKFTADIAKCDGKFVAQKKQKTSDYDQIGCPGDCDPGSDGIQRCTDLAAYDANVTDGTNPDGAKAQIKALGAVIGSFCAVFTGQPLTDPATIDCALNDAKRLSKAAKGTNKCIELCENDYKVPDKKGGGGPTDDATVCDPSNPAAAANFKTCLTKKRDKQILKVLAPANATTVAGLIDVALNTAAQDLYNKDDPTVEPDGSVCSTCGNNSREGVEVCDGTDDASCPGSCNSDCTCP